MSEPRSYTGAFIFDQHENYIGRVGSYGIIYGENDEQRFSIDFQGRVYENDTERTVGEMNADGGIRDDGILVGSWAI